MSISPPPPDSLKVPRRERRRLSDDVAVYSAIHVGIRYAYNIHKATRIRPARVYLSLWRLHELGLISRIWADCDGYGRVAYLPADTTERAGGL